MDTTSVMLSVDGQEPVTVQDFIIANSALGVEPLSDCDVMAIKGMSVGDIVPVWMCRVERVQ